MNRSRSYKELYKHITVNENCIGTPKILNNYGHIASQM
jgi:hypothetical protein